MPYEKKSEDGKVCVYKSGAEEPLKCYSGDKADEQADALLVALRLNVEAAEQKALLELDAEDALKAGRRNAAADAQRLAQINRLIVQIQQLLKALGAPEEMGESKALNLWEMESAIEREVRKVTGRHGGVREVFPGYVIIGISTDPFHDIYYDQERTLWRSGYTVNDDETVTLDDRERWVQVRREYVPVPQPEAKGIKTIEGDHFTYDDTFIALGDQLKAMGEGRVGGYLARFSAKGDDGVVRLIGHTDSLFGTDLVGEWFSPRSYLGPRDGDGAECLFHHGFPLGKGMEGLADHTFQPITTKRDEIGVWATTMLDQADDYERTVYSMVGNGKCGWSIGAAGHRVRKAADGELISYPVAEGSITHRPMAGPQVTQVLPLKSFLGIQEPAPTETDYAALAARFETLLERITRLEGTL